MAHWNIQPMLMTCLIPRTYIVERESQIPQVIH